MPRSHGACIIIANTMEPPAIDLPMEDLLYGINITFPNGTLVSVKKGCAKSVMSLMKLYEKEDAVCLD